MATKAKAKLETVTETLPVPPVGAPVVIDGAKLEELARLFRARKALLKSADLWRAVLDITGGAPLPEVQITQLIGMLKDAKGEPWPAASVAPIKRILSLGRDTYDRTMQAGEEIVAANTEGKLRRLSRNAAQIAQDMQTRILKSGASVDDAITSATAAALKEVKSDAKLGAELLAQIQKMLTDNAKLVRAIAWKDADAKAEAMDTIHEFKSLVCLPDAAGEAVAEVKAA